MINLVTSSGQSVGLIFLVHSIYFQTLFSKKLEQMGWRYSNCRANEVFVKSEEAGDGLSYWTVVWYKLDKRERGGVNKLELSFAVSEG